MSNRGSYILITYTQDTTKSKPNVILKINLQAKLLLRTLDLGITLQAKSHFIYYIKIGMRCRRLTFSETTPFSETVGLQERGDTSIH